MFDKSFGVRPVVYGDSVSADRVEADAASSMRLYDTECRKGMRCEPECSSNQIQEAIRSNAGARDLLELSSLSLRLGGLPGPDRQLFYGTTPDKPGPVHRSDSLATPSNNCWRDGF